MVSGDLLAKIELKQGTFDLNVEFCVPSQIVAVTGPSGSGKSTLLNCIAGIRRPDKGLISLNDQIFFDANKRIDLPPQNRSCGYVLQNLALFPHLNVEQNVCYGIEKWNAADRTARVEELLTFIKLNGFNKRRLNELSGGQLQRVALARAIAPRPKILLLDEPFSSLDSELRELLGRELISIHEQLRIPILLVTHSKSEAANLSKQTLTIENGRIKS